MQRYGFYCQSQRPPHPLRGNRMGTLPIRYERMGYPYDYPWSEGLPLRLLIPVGHSAEDAKVPDLKRKGLDEVSEFFE